MVKSKQLLALVAMGICISQNPNAQASPVEMKPDYYSKVIVDAAVKNDIPYVYLYSLAAKESSAKLENGKRRPWPYTMNYKGKGYYFRSYADLVKASQRLLDSGENNFDVGIFQINYMWNTDRFDGITDLAHPAKNAEIAAQILKEKYDSWVIAAGRYHNPANKNGRANAYSREYLEFLELVKIDILP
ncbi:transglycosylase SLT domain-containing protein [Vibrio sp. TH_r3]|uniref:transglycosylase SLT domain-containing protein n=1 Tax=Vibrio sp. TH_r3 TaxID=3082084 RepID=UPI002953F61A|nr:transglycosylase SLT domain-containing protein [Vibrio sp. TH_r3]MDV7106242.1 transglycosylase SLT domain-containing protein [Vibrio sp. TH_r3]